MLNFIQYLREFSDDETKVANSTSRAAGAVGAKALVPRHVETVESGHDKGKRHILDFGAGHEAAHTKRLREKGHNVTAHEFGSNQRPGVHDPKALDRKYHHVYASNVLNVQSNKKMMGKTLDQIHKSTHKDGAFTGNFPMSPRKAADIDADHVHGELAKRFHHVERVKGMGTKHAPVFHAHTPREDHKYDVHESIMEAEKKPKWEHPLEPEAKKRGYVLKSTFNKGQHSEGRTYAHPITKGSLDVYKIGVDSGKAWRHVNNPGSTSPYISSDHKHKVPSWD